MNDLRDLRQHIAATSDQWYPDINAEGLVRLTRESDEIIVDEGSVAISEKIKIVGYAPGNNLPSHKVSVQLVEEESEPSSNYRYVAKVTDETVQQNTTDAKQDSNRRSNESDPLSERRSSIMSEMNNRMM